MKFALHTALAAFFLVCMGCSDDTSDNANSTPSEPTGKEYLASTEPAQSTPVGEARINAKDGDKVTLLGHIGGSKEPFVEGLAAFTIVDPKVPYCADEEGCPTPWDYCCTQDQVKDNIATIKVVNNEGKVVAEDARKLLGVKELSLVVIDGTAKRDEQGNMTLLANKVFVKK
jgi:hypothetical protein